MNLTFCDVSSCYAISCFTPVDFSDPKNAKNVRKNLRLIETVLKQKFLKGKVILPHADKT